jgi:predicted metal-dependent phosphoesterase TrpH
VNAAAAVGLEALAITDHDTTSALAVARPEADRLGVELVAGVELSCHQEPDGRELHLLGHFVREDDAGLRAALGRLREGRAARLRAMADRLADQGFEVDPEQLRRLFPRATLGRRHLAEYLARTGQVPSLREAFARYLGDGRPACVAKPTLEIVEAIDLVRGAGGVAGLAHPPYDLRLEALRRLADAGMGSIEVEGPGTTSRLRRRFGDWAAELGLVPISGSDFHAPDRPGRWVGAITTAHAELGRLRLARPGDSPSAGSTEAVKWPSPGG